MALLENVVHISQANYDTLIASGSVIINGVTHTYNANNLYVVEEDKNGNTAYITSTSGVSVSLRDEEYYYFEVGTGAYNNSEASLGVVHIDSFSTSAKPILVLGAHSNANSTSMTDNKLIRVVMYRTSANTYNVRIQTSTSSLTSFTAQTSYHLRYWRLNICPNCQL